MFRARNLKKEFEVCLKTISMSSGKMNDKKSENVK
jgi:hypothetical protein